MNYISFGKEFEDKNPEEKLQISINHLSTWMERARKLKRENERLRGIIANALEARGDQGAVLEILRQYSNKDSDNGN